MRLYESEPINLYQFEDKDGDSARELYRINKISTILACLLYKRIAALVLLV